MDNKINLALVGFGRFGKKYYKTLKKENLNKSLKIIRKNKLNQKKLNKILKEQIKKNKFKKAIVVTPTNTHYRISKEFIKNRIPIILEKPAGFNVLEVKKMIKLSKKFKSSVIVNHSDLYNEKFNFILNKINLIGKINLIEANFGKFDKTYKDKNYLPFHDWLPHPLAILFTISKNLYNPAVEYNKIIKKNGSFFQDIIITLKASNIKLIRVRYSNIKKQKIRKIKIYGSNGSICYDGYNHNKNNIYTKKKFFIPKSKKTPMQNVLNFLDYISKNKIYYSDLNLSLKVQKIIEKLNKKIKI